LAHKERFKIATALIEAGVQHVSLLGGEPLLLGDELFEIIKLFKDRNVSVSLVTNGILIDEKAAQRLIDIGPDRLVFSMEGPNSATHDRIRGRGNFNKLVQSIKRIKGLANRSEAKIKILINTVVTCQNKNVAPEMIAFVNDLGADELSFLGLNIAGNASKHYGELMLTLEEEIDLAAKIAIAYSTLGEEYNRMNLNINFIYPLVRDYLQVVQDLDLPFPQICCNAASSLAYINPWGEMHPCDRVFIGHHFKRFQSKKESTKSINLTKSNFYTIWNSSYYLNVFNFVANEKSYEKFSPCKRCEYFHNKKCNPCPLDALELDNFPIHSCLYIEKKAGMPIEALIQRAEELQAESSKKALPPEKLPALEVRPNNTSVHRPSIDRGATFSAHPGIRSAFMQRQKSFFLIHPVTNELISVDQNGFRLWEVISKHPMDVPEMFKKYLIMISRQFGFSSIKDVEGTIYQNFIYFLEMLMQKKFIIPAKKIRKQSFDTDRPKVQGKKISAL